MIKEVLLGLPCVSFEVSSRIVSQPSLRIFEYTGMNCDFGTPIGNGRFKIECENDIAERLLREGFGVFHNSRVYFKEEGMESSKWYVKFKRTYEQTRTKIEKKLETDIDGFLQKHVCDLYSVPIVKSIFGLHENGVIDSDRLLQKLKSYMPEERIAELVSMMEDNKLVA